VDGDDQSVYSQREPFDLRRIVESNPAFME